MAENIRKITPEFQPTKLMLKTEEGTSSNPVGPLFYIGKDHSECRPVFLDLNEPADFRKDGYFPAWFSLKQARGIASGMGLTIEIG